jgi:hypothetical protein
MQNRYTPPGGWKNGEKMQHSAIREAQKAPSACLWIKRTAAISLTLSLAFFVATTLHWPLTGDAALMHYVAFLGNHGFAPYRDIHDMNLPGSYLPDWLIQTAFGPSALAWRFYDFALALAIGAAIWFIAKPYSRFAALWAACLFALIHGRDGMEQAGQRDLAAAALMLASMAILLWLHRTRLLWPAILFGIAAGSALLIKPTLFLILTLPVLSIPLEPDRNRRRTVLLLAYAGVIVPFLVCAAWLAAHGAIGQFLYTVRVLIPYHASVGHAPWRFLLYNGLSPLLPFVLVWMAAYLWPHDLAPKLPRNYFVERPLLLAGIATGLVSYLLQMKAYPYQRYPFLAALLLVAALDLERWLCGRGVRRWLSLAALLWSAFVLAPSSVWKASRYEWKQQQMVRDLPIDLASAAAQLQLPALSRNVQCLDTISGCVDALEHMQLIQSTGFLYDEFLFNPDKAKAIDDSRQSFLETVKRTPPPILIVTDPLFPSGPDGYAKLKTWPEFNTWLSEHYRIFVERTPTQAFRGVGRMVTPSGYRIYILLPHDVH